MTSLRWIVGTLALGLACSSSGSHSPDASTAAGATGTSGTNGSAGAGGEAGSSGEGGQTGGSGGSAVGGQGGIAGHGGAGGQGGVSAPGGTGGQTAQGGSGGCPPVTDAISTSCIGGVVTTRVFCPSSSTVVGTCPFGCQRSGDFGAVGLSICNPAPDGGTDAPLGTFVMCDDHADFNGRGRCAATGKVGAVFATQTRTSGGASTTLTAVFGTTTPPSVAGCTSEAFGASCAVVTCPRSTPANPATVTAAGVITAKSNGGALATTPDAKGKYDVATLGRALWSMPKAAVAFSAAGGATPMFGETFCGPLGTAMTKPAGAPTAALTIDRAADLALAWTPAAVGDVELVARDDGAPSIVELHCSFTGSAGQGTVPKAALAKLTAGAHAISSRLWVRKIGIAKDGTCTELTAITTNDSSTPGAPFEGAATFQ